MSRLTTRDLATAALFTALLAVAAYVTIPVGPVPFTLQVYVVLLAGMLLGPRRGVLSIIAYLILGLFAPVYAGGASGIAALVGPTAGYLFGMVVAVLVTGLVANAIGRTLPRLLLAGLVGLLPLYAMGAFWLALQLDLTATSALATGVLPFAWSDVAKVVLAALTARALVNLPLGLPAEPSGGH